MARPVYGFDPPQPVTIFASAARDDTGAESGVFVSEIYDGIPTQYRGVLIETSVTVDGATSTGFVIDVDTDDGDGDGWVTALASATIDGLGSTLMLLHPAALTDRSNQVEKTSLEYKWRVTWTHSDENAMTGAVLAYFLP
jgi:hypothetical protein